MALAGLHVACGHIDIKEGAVLMGSLSWSQTFSGALTSTVTTTQGASEPGPKGQSFTVAPLGFEITTSVDAWVSWGGSPDPTQTTGTKSTARILVRAGETRNVFCKNGDMLAAIAA
jgi:hypothetical protein